MTVEIAPLGELREVTTGFFLQLGEGAVGPTTEALAAIPGLPDRPRGIVPEVYRGSSPFPALGGTAVRMVTPALMTRRDVVRAVEEAAALATAMGVEGTLSVPQRPHPGPGREPPDANDLVLNALLVPRAADPGPRVWVSPEVGGEFRSTVARWLAGRAAGEVRLLDSGSALVAHIDALQAVLAPKDPPSIGMWSVRAEVTSGSVRTAVTVSGGTVLVAVGGPDLDTEGLHAEAEAIAELARQLPGLALCSLVPTRSWRSCDAEHHAEMSTPRVDPDQRVAVALGACLLDVVWRQHVDAGAPVVDELPTGVAVADGPLVTVPGDGDAGPAIAPYTFAGTAWLDVVVPGGWSTVVDPDGGLVVEGDTVVTVAGAEAIGRTLETGAVRWRRPVAGRPDVVTAQVVEVAGWEVDLKRWNPQLTSPSGVELRAVTHVAAPQGGPTPPPPAVTAVGTWACWMDPGGRVCAVDFGRPEEEVLPVLRRLAIV